MSVYRTMKKIFAGVLLTIIGMIAGLTCDAHAAQANPFQIDFIDVGQGDAMLVSCDGHYMLIDGGDPAPSVLQRLFAAGVTTYRTDVNGTITCVSDGKNVRFVCSK